MSEARTAKGKIRQGQKESVRPLIPAARIQKRIRAMAKEIRRDFPEERLHLVSVLKGGVFFLTDLARVGLGLLRQVIDVPAETGEDDDEDDGRPQTAHLSSPPPRVHA